MSYDDTGTNLGEQDVSNYLTAVLGDINPDDTLYMADLTEAYIEHVTNGEPTDEEYIRLEERIRGAVETLDATGIINREVDPENGMTYLEITDNATHAYDVADEFAPVEEPEPAGTAIPDEAMNLTGTANDLPEDARVYGDQEAASTDEPIGDSPWDDQIEDWKESWDAEADDPTNESYPNA